MGKHTVGEELMLLSEKLEREEKKGKNELLGYRVNKLFSKAIRENLCNPCQKNYK